MNKFKTIMENVVEAEIVEKKSKFIANLFSIESLEDVEKKLKIIRKKYFDAKHHCYAYIISKNNEVIKKSSDDGEPSGTAGAPMLEILEKNNLANVLIIVTRYFGGILLGTGGLVRAYSDSLKKALSNASIEAQESGYELDITIGYPDLDNFNYYCNKNNIRIIENTYLDNVICKVELNNVEKEKIEIDVNNQNNLKIKRIDKIRQKNIVCLSENVD